MKPRKFFTGHRAGWALVAAGALALSTAAFSTTEDEGGAGQTSGTASSGSGYTVPESTSANVTGGQVNGGQDAGGSGTTTGSAGGQGATLANEIKGTIDSIDAARRQVIVRDSQGNLASYKLAPGATVQVGGHKASLAALIEGDVVTITPADHDPASATAIKVGG